MLSSCRSRWAQTLKWGRRPITPVNSRNPWLGGNTLWVAPDETSFRLRWRNAVKQRRNAVKQRRPRNSREAAGEEQENPDSP